MNKWMPEREEGVFSRKDMGRYFLKRVLSQEWKVAPSTSLSPVFLSFSLSFALLHFLFWGILNSLEIPAGIVYWGHAYPNISPVPEQSLELL